MVTGKFALAQLNRWKINYDPRILLERHFAVHRFCRLQTLRSRSFQVPCLQFIYIYLCLSATSSFYVIFSIQVYHHAMMLKDPTYKLSLTYWWREMLAVTATTTAGAPNR